MNRAERQLLSVTKSPLTVMVFGKSFVALVRLLLTALVFALVVGACSDGEAGQGLPPAFELDTFCAATCEAKAHLKCPNDPTVEVCEDRCVRQLPTEGSSCYEEEIAILHCQFRNKGRVFECDHAGKSAQAADVCDEEIRQAVINCGGL